jgi:hypothetical protein
VEEASYRATPSSRKFGDSDFTSAIGRRVSLPEGPQRVVIGPSMDDRLFDPRSALCAKDLNSGRGRRGFEGSGGRSCLESDGDVCVAGELTSASV